MAIWQECDRCGATTKDADSKLWATCALSSFRGKKAESYDLCVDCYREVRSLLLKQDLTVEQRRMLADIWANAQNFDQSIGDVS